jgi:hypothetical protein
MSYSSKDEVLQNRQLKVQRVSIPLSIVGNATPASVVPRNDEPARLFLQTEGVDQITGALDTNETATYTTAASDVNGVFRALLKVRESVEKVVSAKCVNRIDGSFEPAFLGSATGITTGTGGGKSIMLAVDSDVALNAANTLNACLEVEYVVAEQ